MKVPQLISFIIAHYRTLEKLGVKNLAVCENQGKQHKSRVMKTKQGGDGAKKRQND